MESFKNKSLVMAIVMSVFAAFAQDAMCGSLKKISDITEDSDTYLEKVYKYGKKRHGNIGKKADINSKMRTDRRKIKRSKAKNGREITRSTSLIKEQMVGISKE